MTEWGVFFFCDGDDDGKKTQPSFSPLMFVISAFGGNDEQLSEAGIQDKYASGVAGHNRRLRRRNDAANAAELMIEFSLASENYGFGMF